MICLILTYWIKVFISCMASSQATLNSLSRVSTWTCNSPGRLPRIFLNRALLASSSNLTRWAFLRALYRKNNEIYQIKY